MKKTRPARLPYNKRANAGEISTFSVLKYSSAIKVLQDPTVSIEMSAFCSCLNDEIFETPEFIQYSKSLLC
uniref:Uncharacterized protein n=1 Tax=Romanomermis culicivorax TaxID=13658 RepID=A0A915IHY2_ROMCU